MGLFDKLSRPPSKDKYARLLVTGIRKAGERRELTYDAAEFRLRTPDGHIFNLSNLYAEYCSATAESRPIALQRTVRSWFDTKKEIPESFEDASHDLLPNLRSRTYLEMTHLSQQVDGGSELDWPHQVVADHLMLCLVYDLPQSMAIIAQQRLDDWGITLYEALEVAFDNLRRLDSLVVASPAPGLYHFQSGDSYDASRLLLPELIGRFEVAGDPVAIVPNRNHLLLTGSQDESGLAAMAALAEEAFKEPRPISGMAFRLTEDGWMPWMPSTGHACYGRLHSLRVRAEGGDYAEQKGLLDKLHEKRGEDIFVASYTAAEERATASVFSLCVWAKGALSLLPQTERVALMEGDAEPLVADWDRLQAVCGYLMVPVECYPTRFRVDGFPTLDQIKAAGGKPLG